MKEKKVSVRTFGTLFKISDFKNSFLFFVLDEIL